ncbi:MAG: hypothetical protein QXM54_03970, partial [Desulfurococcaceae archaeon]
TSFSRYMWILKELDLVRIVAIEPRPKGFPRTIYTINPYRINDPIWRRPEQTKYPSVDWTIKPDQVKRELRAKYR